MALADVIKTALDQIQVIAKSETIFGDPIQVGAVTLLPVSKISIGFAAGGGDKEGKITPAAGTGGGITITPVAFISIVGEKVEVLSLNDDDLGINKIIQMAPGVMKTITNFIKKKTDSADSTTSES